MRLNAHSYSRIAARAERMGERGHNNDVRKSGKALADAGYYFHAGGCQCRETLLLETIK